MQDDCLRIEHPPARREAVLMQLRRTFLIATLLWLAQTATGQIEVATLQPASEGVDTFYGTTFYTSGQPYKDELWFGGWGDAYFPFLQFDLTGSPAPTATITAQLHLYAAHLGPFDPGLQLWRVTEAWTETAVTASANPTGQFLFNLPPVQLGWNIIDITSIYLDWKANPAANFGIELVSSNTNNTRGDFQSSDSANAPDLRPKIMVTYDTSVVTFVHPVAVAAPETQPFSAYNHLSCPPISSPNDRYHPGVDFGPVGIDEPVYAAGTGEVCDITPASHANGNSLKILHGNGLVTQYLHLKDPPATSAGPLSGGDLVVSGEQIGIMGDTGLAFGTHLHFGARRDCGSAPPAFMGTGYAPDIPEAYAYMDPAALIDPIELEGLNPPWIVQSTSTWANLISPRTGPGLQYSMVGASPPCPGPSVSTHALFPAERVVATARSGDWFRYSVPAAERFPGSPASTVWANQFDVICGTARVRIVDPTDSGVVLRQDPSAAAPAVLTLNGLETQMVWSGQEYVLRDIVVGADGFRWFGIEALWASLPGPWIREDNAVIVPLDAAPMEMSGAFGGTISLNLRAGGAFVGRKYLVALSFSGSQPGVMLPSGCAVPLNPDGLTSLMLTFAPLFGLVGTLDSTGAVTIQLGVPGGLIPSGTKLTSAAVILPDLSLISNAAEVTFVP